MTGKGSGRRKENTELVRKNWEKIKWTDEGKQELANHQQKISPNIIWVDELEGDDKNSKPVVNLNVRYSIGEINANVEQYGSLDIEKAIRERHVKQMVYDALEGSGDTYEEKVSLSDEMRLHQEKHKPEGE